ncbi:MAG TPA: von Willebrand factor type A domain-containing protein [Opitutaceae bacterium]|nr:von Willebrand factor type A domain-containing protein [Opitutaceae bacterium]
MNDRFSPDDPQLTAYALGELEGDERAAIEAALRRDPSLRCVVDEIRAAAGRIEAVLAEETALPASRLPVSPAPAPGLRPGVFWRRTAAPKRINGTHRRLRRPAKVLAFPQLYFVVGGCAAAGVALFIALQPTPGPASATRNVPTVAKVSAGTAATVLLPTTEPVVAENPSVSVAAIAEVTVPSTEVTGEARERDESLAGQLTLIAQARPVERAPIEFKFNIPSVGLMAANNGSLPVGAGTGLRVAAPPPVITPGDFRSNPIESSSQAYARRRNEMKFSIPFKFGAPAENRPTDPRRLDLAAPAESERAAPPLRVSPERAAPLSDQITPEMLERARAGAVPGSSTDLFSGPRRVGAGGRRDMGRAGRGTFQPGDGFISVAQTTLSFIPLSSETGSYADLQRAIRTRQLPRASTVRIEEMLNAFPWRYAAPTNEPVAASLEVAEAPWAPTHRLVRIGLKIRDVAANAAAVPIAREALARVEFNPEKVSGYRLIGYETDAADERAAAREPVRGSDLAAGTTLTVLYEIVPAGTTEAGPDVVVLIDDLKYGTPRQGRSALPPGVAQEMLTLTVQYREVAAAERKKLEFPLVDAGARFAAASPDFKFAAAVAGFGLILRNSPQKGTATMGNVIDWAIGGVTGPEDDAEGARAEFIDLARRAQALLRGE